MESGRSGRRGVYVHLHVVEAKERERGHAPPRSTAGGRVKGPRLIISLVILLSAQVSVLHVVKLASVYFVCP